MKCWISLLLALTMTCCAAGALAQERDYIAAIYVEDEISEYAYGYDHLGTLELIDTLMEDADNRGIYLYLNSPGGYLYESDELYEKLMRYKAQTGNGIYCYIGAQACSGAFYVAMAADYIAAGKMSEVGNVGVYLETVSYQGLYEKLGIEYNIISTGENKLEGIPTLTQTQREIITERIKEALRTLFVNDETSARPAGSMEVVKLFWWKHNCSTGQYSSARVHRSLHISQGKQNGELSLTLDPLPGLNVEELEGE